MKEKFDKRATEAIAGVRAVWLLYKRGRWSYLEDFGVERDKVEPVLRTFEATHVINNDRLTTAQAKRLVKLVPEVADAGKELRLAYVLRFVDKSGIDMAGKDVHADWGLGSSSGGVDGRRNGARSA